MAEKSKKPLRDPRVRDYIQPERIVWSEGVESAERLLRPGSGQTTVWAGPGAILRFGSSLLLDFGHELHGGVQLISGATKGNVVLKIRLRFGESVSEAMGEPNNDHALHDATLEIPPMGWTEFGCTGFRFVRVDSLSTDHPLEIKELRAVSLMREIEWKGSFECSDERLNRIWRTGARMTQLCMQDYVWDGIKRDRLVWMGDMHPELMVASSVFGRQDVFERSLVLVRDEAPLPKFMNGTSSYSLWWIVAQADWLRFHGSLEYLEGQREYLLNLLSLLRGYIQPDGSERLDATWRFLDWSNANDEKAIHCGLQALFLLAFEAGARLCAALGETEAGKECLATVELLRRHAPEPCASKSANALLVLAGLADAKRANESVLAKEPLAGVSTFYGYYVLQARAKAGDIQGCLDLIREYWGGMLDLGATSFWEHFDVSWKENATRIDELPQPGRKDVHRECGDHCYKGLRHSLCHGWASGPTAWLSEHVLGVRVLKPGASLVEIKPSLGDLAWARGSFPTPAGLVEVSCKRGKNGAVECEVSLPPGVERV